MDLVGLTVVRGKQTGSDERGRRTEKRTAFHAHEFAPQRLFAQESTEKRLSQWRGRCTLRPSRNDQRTEPSPSLQSCQAGAQHGTLSPFLMWRYNFGQQQRRGLPPKSFFRPLRYPDFSISNTYHQNISANPATNARQTRIGAATAHDLVTHQLWNESNAMSPGREVHIGPAEYGDSYVSRTRHSDASA